MVNSSKGVLPLDRTTNLFQRKLCCRTNHGRVGEFDEIETPRDSSKATLLVLVRPSRNSCCPVSGQRSPGQFACNPTLAEKHKHLGLQLEQDLSHEPRGVAVTPNKRVCCALSSAVSQTKEQKVQRHDRRGQCDFFTSTVAKKCVNWCDSTASRLGISGVEMVTALLSSTPAAAERPATPLSKGSHETWRAS